VSRAAWREALIRIIKELQSMQALFDPYELRGQML
jgi:hypothetical protein